MAYKFTEKQDNRQQQVAYGLYMIGSSYFHKSICTTRRLETILYLDYQDMPVKRQEELEEKLISSVEAELQNVLPVLERMNCQASIKRCKDEYHILFETGFETVSMVVDKKGHYQIRFHENTDTTSRVVA